MAEARANSHPEGGQLVVMEMKCSYPELVHMIERLPFCRPSSSSTPMPSEIIHRIANFFIVHQVVKSDVKAIRATSSSNHFPLEAALDESRKSWWISATGSMPSGKGEEFVEFRLSPNLCRLNKFSVQIPPMPMGPLSVREFYLTSRVDESSVWTRIGATWTVENNTGWQDYSLNPPVDTQDIRVVCLTNQMSMVLDQMSAEQLALRMQEQFTCVGYYGVKFE